jgi:NADH:ubiquinone oxidoreductase subunit 6 (subunit J)
MSISNKLNFKIAKVAIKNSLDRHHSIYVLLFVLLISMCFQFVMAPLIVKIAVAMAVGEISVSIYFVVSRPSKSIEELWKAIIGLVVLHSVIIVLLSALLIYYFSSTSGAIL